MIQKIDITNSTIIRFILILLGLYFLYMIRDVLALVFMVLIIVAALYPTVDKWSRYVTRPGAVITLFVIILLILIGAFSLLFPPLITQIKEVSSNLPQYVNQLNQTSSDGNLSQLSKIVTQNLDNVSNQLGNVGGTLLDTTVGFVSGMVAIATIFVVSFYLLVDEEGWKKLCKGLVPADIYEKMTDMILKIAGKLGAWLRGELVVMAIVGSLTGVGLVIVGTPYALTLGVMAGLFEIIPMIGAWISAAVGLIIGLTVSPLHGLLALLVYGLVQQIEGHILIPKIMGKAVGLNPVVVILAILIGDKVYGLLGVLLAVPLAAVISVLFEDWSVIRETFSSRKS